MKKREVWTFLIYVIRCMTVHPNERGCQFFVDLIFSIAGRVLKFDLFIQHTLIKCPGCAWPWEYQQEKAEPCSHGADAATGRQAQNNGTTEVAGGQGQLAQSEGSMWGPQSAWGNQVLETKLEESLELYLTEWGQVLDSPKVSTGRTTRDAFPRPNSPHVLSFTFLARCCL